MDGLGAKECIGEIFCFQGGFQAWSLLEIPPAGLPRLRLCYFR